MRDQSMLKNALIAVLATVLLIAGLAIIVYVTIARDRIVPTPTPRPTSTITPTPMPTSTDTPLPTDTAVPLVTGVGKVREYSPGALIIVMTPIEGNVEQVIVPEDLEDVTRASGERVPTNVIVPGQTIFAEGTLDPLGRMIAQRIIITEEPTPTPTAVSPTPTLTPVPPTPTMTPIPAWQGEYYDNKTLSRTPVLVRQDLAIDFDWQLGSPDATMPANDFSVRWTGRWSFEEGRFRFYAAPDDGVRVWVDEMLIIDQWRDQAVTLFYGDLYLYAGPHDVRVEYYEGGDLSEVRVWWEHKGEYLDWKGEYYDNRELEGEPVLVRNDVNVNFDWGEGPPASEVPADNFSARWTRSLNFSEGEYRFFAHVDDGIRIWIDDRVIVDQWYENAPAAYEGYAWLNSGSHNMRIEFFEAAGSADVHVWWEEIQSFAHWRGEYYGNPSLAGQPTLVRDDETIDFDWQIGSPALVLPVDNFSVRWIRIVSLGSGLYRFWVSADDGVRVYVDEQLVIDEWRDSPAERIESQIPLSSGEHTIIVEYYDRGDLASIRMGWDNLTTATPTPTGTLTETPTLLTATATPTATDTAAPATATQEASPTSPPPTATPTDSPEASTPTATSEAATATPPWTWTPELATATPTLTWTSEPPTAAPTLTATPEPPTPTATETPIPPTATFTPSIAPTSEPSATETPAPKVTGAPEESGGRTKV